MALATITATPVLAREDAQKGGSLSVQGAVSDVSDATVKLLGGLVTVDASGAAIVAEQDNIPLTICDVKVGSVIEVDGTMTGQVLNAASIQVQGLRLNGTIKGPIDTADPAGNHFSLLGPTIAVVPSTVFVGNNKVPAVPDAGHVRVDTEYSLYAADSFVDLSEHQQRFPGSLDFAPAVLRVSYSAV